MTFIEIEDLDLVELKIRWEVGDKFALIETIAFCAAQDREYPKWVRSQIDDAMTTIFQAVFPKIDFKIMTPALARTPDPDEPKEAEQIKRFEAAAAEAAKMLCLKIDRDNPLATRKRAIRDFILAEMVAEYSNFQLVPMPKFSGVTKVMKDLVAALHLSQNDWAELVREDGVLPHLVNGKELRVRDIPSECRMATVDVIRNAWEKSKEALLALRVDEHEERFGPEITD